MSPGKTALRSNRGSTAAELPLMLWVVFMVLFFPLLDLAAVCLRSTFLYLAAHSATFEAARAKTFSVPVNGSPSAVQLASAQAQAVASSFSGITVNKVTVNIISTDVNTLSVARQSTPLTTPADSTLNTYQIEVAVQGSLSPFFNYGSRFFGDIPGLTAPIKTTFVDRQFCENPQGLNI